MREHDTELVVQLVKQQAELWIRCEAFHSRAIRRLALLGRMPRSGVCRVRTVAIRGRRSGARVPP